MSYTYTENQQIEEISGCWEDYLTPDEHLDALDAKLYEQSQGYRPWRTMNNY